MLIFFPTHPPQRRGPCGSSTEWWTTSNDVFPSEQPSVTPIISHSPCISCLRSDVCYSLHMQARLSVRKDTIRSSKMIISWFLETVPQKGLENNILYSSLNYKISCGCVIRNTPPFPYSSTTRAEKNILHIYAIIAGYESQTYL
jgi:hypothetical protein